MDTKRYPELLLGLVQMVLADEPLNMGPCSVGPINVRPVSAGPRTLLRGATRSQDQRNQNENDRNITFPGSWASNDHFVTPRQKLHPLNSSTPLNEHDRLNDYCHPAGRRCPPPTRRLTSVSIGFRGYQGC